MKRMATVAVMQLIGFLATMECAGALLVARDQGFFRKYDLDVNLIYMRNAAVALSALSAGEAQFYSGSANGSVLGAIANGLAANLVDDSIVRKLEKDGLFQ
ncbi:MAG: ABC transporter substrate-binding protein [Candidatus Binatia bacterium]